MTRPPPELRASDRPPRDSRTGRRAQPTPPAHPRCLRRTRGKRPIARSPTFFISCENHQAIAVRNRLLPGHHPCTGKPAVATHRQYSPVSPAGRALPGSKWWSGRLLTSCFLGPSRPFNSRALGAARTGRSLSLRARGSDSPFPAALLVRPAPQRTDARARVEPARRRR